MLQQIEINCAILSDEKYNNLYSVEAVMEGNSFRNAYKKQGCRLLPEIFNPSKKLAHLHRGSLGNLCPNNLRKKMEHAMEFNNKF